MLSIVPDTYILAFLVENNGKANIRSFIQLIFECSIGTSGTFLGTGNAAMSEQKSPWSHCLHSSMK